MDFWKNKDEKRKRKIFSSISRKYSILYQSYSFNYGISEDLKEGESYEEKYKDIRERLEKQRKKEIERIKKEALEIYKVNQEIREEIDEYKKRKREKKGS
jgi:heme oxygenase